MEDAFSIKSELPVALSNYTFGLADDGSLSNVRIETEDELTLETMNSIVGVLAKYMDGYSLNVNLTAGNIQARVR